MSIDEGTVFEGRGIAVLGGVPGGPIVLGRELGRGPHAVVFVARQGPGRCTVSVLDPVLGAPGPIAAGITADVARAAQIQHRSLLECFGVGEHDGTSFVVRADPGAPPLRKVLEREGPTVPAVVALRIAGHLCGALADLHRVAVHGYVTIDTVHVTPPGRVVLGAAGEGPWLPRAPGFARARAAGILAGYPPEMLDPSRPAGPAADVFAVAALLHELVSGRPPTGNLALDLGPSPPGGLAELLVHALAPDPAMRPPDVFRLAFELARIAEALPEPDAVAEAFAKIAPPPPPVFPAYAFPPGNAGWGATAVAVPTPMAASPTPVPTSVPPGVPVPRPRAEPTPPPRPPPPPRARAARPALQDADLAGLEEVAMRLERLADVGALVDVTDHDELAGPTQARRPPAASPVDPEVELAWDQASMPAMARVRKAEADRRRIDGDDGNERYVIVRSGIEEGPYTLAALHAMLEARTLDNADVLRRPDRPETLLVADVPMLRSTLEARLRQLEPARTPTLITAASPGTPGAAHGGPLGTVSLVAAILLGFAAIGWVLWARAQ